MIRWRSQVENYMLWLGVPVLINLRMYSNGGSNVFSVFLNLYHLLFEQNGVTHVRQITDYTMHSYDDDHGVGFSSISLTPQRPGVTLGSWPAASSSATSGSPSGSLRLFGPC